MRGVTPTTARSHLVSGGMAPHQFFFLNIKNNSISDVIKIRVLTVHEGHMGHYRSVTTNTEELKILPPPVFVLSILLPG